MTRDYKEEYKTVELSGLDADTDAIQATIVSTRIGDLEILRKEGKLLLRGQEECKRLQATLVSLSNKILNNPYNRTASPKSSKIAFAESQKQQLNCLISIDTQTQYFIDISRRIKYTQDYLAFLQNDQQSNISNSAKETAKILQQLQQDLLIRVQIECLESLHNSKVEEEKNTLEDHSDKKFWEQVLKYFGVLLTSIAYGITLIVVGIIAFQLSGVSALFSSWLGAFLLIAAVCDAIVSFSFLQQGFDKSFKENRKTFEDGVGKRAYKLARFSAVLAMLVKMSTFYFSFTALLVSLTTHAFAYSVLGISIVVCFSAMTGIVATSVFFSSFVKSIESVKNQRHLTKGKLHNVSKRLAISVAVGVMLTILQVGFLLFGFASWLPVTVSILVSLWAAVVVYRKSKFFIQNKLTKFANGDNKLDDKDFYYTVSKDNGKITVQKLIIPTSGEDKTEEQKNKNLNNYLEIRDRFGKKVNYLENHDLKKMSFISTVPNNPIHGWFEKWSIKFSHFLNALDKYMKKAFKALFTLFGLAIVAAYLVIKSLFLLEVTEKNFGVGSTYVAPFMIGMGTVALRSGYYNKHASKIFGETLGVDCVYKLLKTIVGFVLRFLESLLIIITSPFIYGFAKPSNKKFLKDRLTNSYQNFIKFLRDSVLAVLMVVTIIPLFHAKTRNWLQANFGNSALKLLIDPLIYITWIVMTAFVAIGMALLAPEDSLVEMYIINSCFTLVTYTPSAVSSAKSLSNNIVNMTKAMLLLLGILTVVPALSYCVYAKYFKTNNVSLGNLAPEQRKQEYKKLAMVVTAGIMFSTGLILASIFVSAWISIALYLAIYCTTASVLVNKDQNNHKQLTIKNGIYAFIPFLGIRKAVANLGKNNEQNTKTPIVDMSQFRDWTFDEGQVYATVI